MSEQMNPSSAQEGSFLDDFDTPQYIDASRGIRFANFILDYIFILVVIGVLAAISGMEAYDYYGSLNYSYYFLNMTVYIVYYTIFEGLWGRTPAKFITGTIVIMEEGTQLEFAKAFLRSLCRFIPFEPFSGFGIPWHDSLTHTRVVKYSSIQ